MIPTIDEVKHMFNYETDVPTPILQDWVVEMYSDHPLIRSGQVSVEEVWPEKREWTTEHYFDRRHGKKEFYGEPNDCLNWCACVQRSKDRLFYLFDLIETCLFLSLNPDLESIE